MKTGAFAVTLVICMSMHASELEIHRLDDHVYWGKQPEEGQFSELADRGTRTVLDLRGGSLHKPRERKQAETAGMHYISIRLSGIWAPKNNQIAEILAVLENPVLQPVFVHCRRGDDRVGLVIACYRMVHDHWTNEQALAEAKHYGLNPLEILMKHYIRNFDPAKLPPVPADFRSKMLAESAWQAKSEGETQTATPASR